MISIAGGILIAAGIIFIALPIALFLCGMLLGLICTVLSAGFGLASVVSISAAERRALNE